MQCNYFINMIKTCISFVITAFAIKIAVVLNELSAVISATSVEHELHEFLLQRMQKDFLVKSFVQTFPGDLRELTDFEPDIVLDYSTKDLWLLRNAQTFSDNSDYFIANNYSLLPHPNIKHLKESQITLLQKAKLIASYFGWTESILVVQDVELMVASNQDQFFKLLSLSSGLNKDYYDSFVTREIRVSGIHSVFVIADKSTIESLLESFTKYEMDKGYAIILLSSHCQFNLSLYPTGLLCLSLAGTEAVRSLLEIDFWYLWYALTSTPITNWSITNIVQGKRYVVGSFAGQALTLSPLIVFPRGITAPNWNEPFTLTVNLNDCVNGSQRISAFAFAKIPLSNSKFKVRPLTLCLCGEYSVDKGYLDCYIAAKTEKTLILLSSDFRSQPAYQMEYMRRSSLILPFASSESYIEMLSSNALYPNFVRLVQTSTYLTNHMLLLNILLKYTSYMMFHSPVVDEFTLSYAELTLKNRGITFTNPKDLRSLNFTDEAYTQQLVTFVKESEIRPILFIAAPADIVKLLLYFAAEGINSKEVVMVGALVSFQELILRTSETELDKVLKFKSSWISLDFATYIDQKGDLVRQRVVELFGLAYFSDCMSYDLANNAALALDFALKRGLNINNWKEMVFALKAIRFVGCSGPIKFSSEDNNRISIDIDISQARQLGDVVDDVKILRTSLTGQQNFYFYSTFEWYNNSPTPPKQNRLTYEDCPFPEEYRSNCVISQKLTAAINWSLVGVAFSLSAFIYIKFYRRSKFYDNTGAILMSTQDYIVFISTLAGIFIFELVSPGDGIVSTLLGDSFAVWRNLDIKGDTAFQLLRLCYVLIGAGTFCLLITIGSRFKTLSLDFHLIAYLLIQPANFLLILCLVGTFDCSEAISSDDDPELTDAFMDLDCSIKCWSGSHMKYVIASSVILVVFLVVFTPFMSPFTNNLDGLQYNINPSFLLVSKPIQLTLIALDKSKGLLPRYFHSISFLIILAVHCCMCNRIRVFSIQVLDTIHNMLLTGLFIIYTALVLYLEAYSNAIVWGTVGGFFVIVVMFLFIRRIRSQPSMIVSPPPVDTVALFKFAYRVVNHSVMSLRLPQMYRQISNLGSSKPT